MNWTLLVVLIISLNENFSHGVPYRFPSESNRNKTAKSQIVGGVASGDESWPWQVAVNTLQDGQFKFRCGGSLIAADVVLTAAHCLRNPDVTAEMVQAVAGDVDRLINEETEQTRNVHRIAIHPGYTGTLSSLYSHDIALLKLSGAMTPTPGVVSIVTLASLNSSAVAGIDTCVITGWGISETKYETNSLTNRLSSADMSVLSNGECNNSQYWDGLVKLFQMCAYNKRISACLGDSGGPLVCQKDKNYVQYGVTSWGSKSCDRKPSVFTRVSFYYSWIQDSIAKLKS